MLRKQDDKTILGIDIGSDAVRVVRGMKQKGGITILDFAQKGFLTECPADALIRNMQEALSSLVDAKKIKSERVHATISGRKLCIRVITLPVMPAQELRQFIKAKICKYVSSDIDEIYFQSFVLGEKYEAGIKKLEIMFVAMQKSVFNDYLRLFAPFNMQPQLITTSCFGGWNLIRHLGLYRPVTSVMLINIDGQETDLTVYRDERFVFTRNISIGAKEFIDMAKKGGASEAQPPSLSLQQVDILCKEIELTSNHYYQIEHGQRIDQCFVLGEGCNVLGLIDFLKQKTDIPLSALQIPAAQLELSKDKSEEFRKNAAVYAQSLGALLSEPDGVNLIGRQAKKMGKVAQVKQILISLTKTKAMAIILIAGVLLYGTFKGINLYYKREIFLLKRRQVSLEDKAVQLMGVKRMMDTLEPKKKIYHQLKKDYPSYLMIIDQICQAIPSKHIVLDELSLATGQRGGSPSSNPQYASGEIKFSITGRLVGEGITGFEVTQFVSALEQGGYFENVSVANREAGSFTIYGDVRVRDEQRT